MFSHKRSLKFLVFGAVLTCLCAQPAPAANDLAGHLVKLSGYSRGVCTLIGADDPELPVALAESTDMLVHVLDPRESEMKAARNAADAPSLHGTRIVVESMPLARLPYADSMVSSILCSSLNADALAAFPLAEAVRVLHPHGVAVLGASGDVLKPRTLKQWLRAKGVDGEVVTDAFGTWAVITKAEPEGVDDWSHWEHSPDNNPVSTDQCIKAPYMTQFLGKPYYIAMPAITTVAGGRTFLAMGHIAHHEREEEWLNTLVAHNGYNGAELWRKKLPDGYMVHRSAFIATDDIFYMIDLDGTGCLLLDPDTGEEVGRVHLPEYKGEWKWIALKDGVLYALIGQQKDPAEATLVRATHSHWSWGALSPGYYAPRVPWGFGNTLLAYDLGEERVVWEHEEEGAIDSRALIMGGDRMYFYAPDTRAGCLNDATGALEWVNGDPKIRELIEEPGVGLGSTPGFRSTAFAIYTPEVLCYEAQTRNNIVALSTEDGSLLWHKKKTTNNPNMIYIDGDLLVGIGEQGNTLVVDPKTGEVEKDLGFKKRSCVRLTATPDSLFVRGYPEGLTRYDRQTGEIQFNGALRPACNDGVIGANGLLYTGPWLCDCNLSLMGRIVMTSAGDFDFSIDTSTPRLQAGAGGIEPAERLDVTEADWEDYRGGPAHASNTPVDAPMRNASLWTYNPEGAFTPTAPTAADGLILVGADDGKIRAFDTKNGTPVWEFTTAGPIMQPPSLWNGRTYVGSGDGYVYCLEASTGRLLWRFRAAPIERRIMTYGALCSTWPVNSGVLVQDGVAYAAAGIIDYDGTYVYALDAETGAVKWANTTSGHLRKDLRKGVSAQGNLAIYDGRLVLAGGNIVGLALYDLETGEYEGIEPRDGAPQNNRGEEVALLADTGIVTGGRLRYSATESVISPASFNIFGGEKRRGSIRLGNTRVPPAHNDSLFVVASNPDSVLTGYAVSAIAENISKPGGGLGTPLWEAEALKGMEVLELAVAPNAVVAIVNDTVSSRYAENHYVNVLNPEDGSLIWREPIPGYPAPRGLLLDRDGRIIVVAVDGRIAAYGTQEQLMAMMASAAERVTADPAKKEATAQWLSWMLARAQTPEAIEAGLDAFDTIDAPCGRQLQKNGVIMRWKLLGPLTFGDAALQKKLDRKFAGADAIDLNEPVKVPGRTLYWRDYFIHDNKPVLPLPAVIGNSPQGRAFLWADLDLPESGEVAFTFQYLFPYTVWFNGEEIGTSEGQALRPGVEVEPLTMTAQARKGRNTLLIRVNSLHWYSSFTARVADGEGNPIDLGR